MDLYKCGMVTNKTQAESQAESMIHLQITPSLSSMCDSGYESAYKGIVYFLLLICSERQPFPN